MTIHDVIAKYRRRWKHIAECRQAVDDFAERLNAALKRLKRRKWTQEQIAIDCGFSQAHLHNLCQGLALPTLDELESLTAIIDDAENL